MSHYLKKHKKLVIISIISVMLFTFIPNITQALTTFEQKLELISEIYDVVQEYHITGADTDTLARGAIDGMLESLDDPYTRYFSDEEFDNFLSSLDNNFVGIGIYIEEKDGLIYVQSPIKDSPAEKAGLQPGDAIISANGIDIRGKSTEEAASLIKGKEGTKVILVIQRGAKILTFTIERKSIQLPLVESEMLTKDIGYIRLYQFGRPALTQFNNHLSSLKEQGMKKLIFDLRGNPGGYVDVALNIAKNFIKQGPIVYVKDKTQKENSYNIYNGTDWNDPLVVLIDKGSASASEIVTGALKDYNKATVIGENSYGKGTVQQMLPLNHGGYIKITFEEYFTPLKNKMNGVGITPDIEVKDPNEQLAKAILTLSEDITTFNPTLGEDWQKQAEKSYIALRPLIDTLGGTIKYDAATRTITVELGDSSADFSLDNTEGLELIDGKAYVDVDTLRRNFYKIFIIEEADSMTIFSL